MPLIPVYERLRQANLCEFQASLVYIVNSRKAKARPDTIATLIPIPRAKQNQNKQINQTTDFLGQNIYRTLNYSESESRGSAASVLVMVNTVLESWTE